MLHLVSLCSPSTLLPPPRTEAHGEPHPHPAAPEEVASDFKHFQEVYSSGPHFHPEKIQAAAPASSGAKDSGAPADRKLNEGEVSDIHELPKRYWDTPASHFEEAELEAIMVSRRGAGCERDSSWEACGSVVCRAAML